MKTTQQIHPWRAAIRTTLEVALVLTAAAIAAGAISVAHVVAELMRV